MNYQADSKKIRLFISKPVEELRLLPEFCSKNSIFLVAHSFLSFEAVSFQFEKSIDVVFFASPRSAHFFLEQSDLQKEIQIAVAGESTRKHLESKGIRVHFSPKNSGNIEDSSIEFAQWLNGRKVLFPTSDISYRSYTKQLNPSQFETVQVYTTHIVTRKIEGNDIYVFTSPSNVKGFFESNTILSDKRVISWGETTHNSLAPYIEPDCLRMLQQSSEESLIALLEKYI